MNDYLKILIKSILGGFLIGMGGTVYLMYPEYRFVGAFLFSIGLFGILTFGFNLYTGKVGYIPNNKPSYLIEVLITIIGNFIGCLILGLSLPMDAAVTCCNAKLALTPYAVFIKGVCCGILMYIAVEYYKTKGGYLATFICVPAFILAGFEHSIADMFYLSSAGIFTADALVFVLIVLFGNYIGCCLIPWYRKYVDAPSPKPKTD